MVSWLRHQPKQTRIGLDIAASGVRGVQLVGSGDSYAVYGAASHQRQGADAGDIGTEHFLKGEALAAGIQGCLRKATFRGRNAIAALNPPAVEFCTLELPAAVLVNGKADASNVVRWEMGRLTNEPIDDVETGDLEPVAEPLSPAKLRAGSAVAGRLDLCACKFAGRYKISKRIMLTLFFHKRLKSCINEVFEVFMVIASPFSFSQEYHPNVECK